MDRPIRRHPGAAPRAAPGARALRPPVRSRRRLRAPASSRRRLDVRPHRRRDQRRRQPRAQSPSVVRVVRATEDRGRRAREVAIVPQAAPACRDQARAEGTSAAGNGRQRVEAPDGWHLGAAVMHGVGSPLRRFNAAIAANRAKDRAIVSYVRSIVRGSPVLIGVAEGGNIVQPEGGSPWALPCHTISR